MAAYCREQEIKCTIHWFSTWSPYQKAEFLKVLLEKARPQEVASLFDAMESLNVRDKPPNIFQCQVKLFKQWFDDWSLEDRKDYLNRIEVVDPVFVSQLNEAIAASSQQPHN